ncbi:hypothetical protein BABINDRAFT_159932 [Babjeviella inositovora NRRL Y-12698]|uniref:RING-Gid-type domain-containing protein n=1 Tax=Babjeviella inositovora NRRL Y-12698 TaxID=984486 RepID=A0A1E3QX72_9ASCO|nr:uncharacterized protein BABINDRAFT_159932 [Babjeviella inositovora NRRL Y-12698]ODQ81672.1 hypothetical protein BABINDRAFT_159932 [Babjeviella inositovora NRRL Y-12698]
MSVDFHILLQQSNFKIPHELAKKNLKSIQKLIEKQKKQVLADLSKITGAQAAVKLSKQQRLEALAKIIRGFDAFLTKLLAKATIAADFMHRLQCRSDKIKELQTLISASSEDSGITAQSIRLGQWYRDQINLLVVDYLLKSSSGGENIGLELLEQLAALDPNLKNLIDFDVYVQYNKIYTSITQDHDISLLNSWFQDNKLTIKKIVYVKSVASDEEQKSKETVEYGSSLEFELKFQEFLNIVTEGSIIDAIGFCKTSLAAYMDLTNYTYDYNYHQNIKRITNIGGILLYKSMQTEDGMPKQSENDDSQEPGFVTAYHTLVSQKRWLDLGKLFTADFFQIYGISYNYPLFIYLSAGLCSLKTKSCAGCDVEYITSKHAEGLKASAGSDTEMDLGATDIVSPDLSSRGSSAGSSVPSAPLKVNFCPVCSAELYDLTTHLPFAHLVTSSIISGNPIMLPNGNIYDEDKLFNLQEKLRSKELREKDSEASGEDDSEDDEMVYDPITGEKFEMGQIEKAYPT